MKTLQEIYFKEESVDEPEGGILGKVVFGQMRKDNVEEERDTDIESELFDALDEHYNTSDDSSLEKIAPKIMSLLKSGKYQILKAPENQMVYRMMTKIPIKMASKIIGIDSEKLLKPENKNEVIYYPVNSALETSKIQSWTLDSNIILDYICTKVKRLSEVRVVLVLISNTSNGFFFMSPNFQEKILVLDKHSDEKETISYGTVKINGALVAYGDLKGKSIDIIINKFRKFLK